MCVHIHRVERLASGVFINHSPPYNLRQLNLEFISSSQFTAREPHGSSHLCLLHPSMRGVHHTQHLYEFWRSEQGPSLPGLQLSLLRTLQSRYVGEWSFLFERCSCAMQPIEEESTPALRFPHMNYAAPGLHHVLPLPALNVCFLLV